MQLIEVNDPVIHTNKTMSTLGQALETNSLSLDTDKETSNVSQEEEILITKAAEAIKVENEKTKKSSEVNLNINGIIKINGVVLDHETKNEPAIVENKIETNGPSNGNSNPSEDSEISVQNSTDVIESIKNLEDNDLKVTETKQTILDEVSSGTLVPILQNTPKDINILIDDGDIFSFSPNSDIDEKQINISSQLQQLENDAAKEDVNTTPSIVLAEINKEDIVQETEAKYDTLNPIEENNANLPDSLSNEDHDKIVTKETELTDVQSSVVNKPDTQSNGISEVTSTANESIVDKVSEEALVSNNISVEIDHGIINKTNEEKASELPPSESIKEIDQQESMGIDVLAPETEVLAENIPSTLQVEEKCTKQEKKDKSIELEKLSKEESHKVEEDENLRKEILDKIDDENIAKDIDLTYEKQIKLDEKGKGEIHQNISMDVDEPIICSSEVTCAEKINSAINKNDFVKNGSINGNSTEQAVVPDTIEEINNTTIESTTAVNPCKEIEQEEKINDVMEIDDAEEILTETSAVVACSSVVPETDKEPARKQDAVICISDNKETKEKESNPANNETTDNEPSEIISIDESENDASQDKPVITLSTIDPIVAKEKAPQLTAENKPGMTLPVCKLSNTMDILSDDEDEPPTKPVLAKKTEEPVKESEENKCINIDDDDDIMFIEDTNSQEHKHEQNELKVEPEVNKIEEKHINDTKTEELGSKVIKEDKPTVDQSISLPKEEVSIPTEPSAETKPIITKSFLTSVTKNLADMTRNELEDFCILKLVESVVDKSNLTEIKNKMKTMTQTLEDLRKKTMALTKQNRDLQVVVKTVQEDQKKRNTNPMMPMKITRSVGMQVVLSGEKSLQKRKMGLPPQPPPPMTPARPNSRSQGPKTQPKPPANNIPVPRLVPASSPTLKSPAAPTNNVKITTVKNVPPQRPEKRPHTKITSPASSVTVDLTDDEPPSKVTPKNATPPVRLVPSQNLMPKNRAQFTPNNSNNARESPRKVYIPISSNTPPNARPIVPKNFNPSPRPRLPISNPSVVRMQTVRLNQTPSTNRHPAPLPDAMKQYQPPAWKALPPAPDLKLSKVDNGIVISWKFEGYQPDSYEEVASFQLYAYQETPAPPSTALWKKIGDIKALPLPMACTLTQFMSGFKYYFAVRAIDVRSRIGPFSLPGSIMLISKS